MSEGLNIQIVLTDEFILCSTTYKHMHTLIFLLPGRPPCCTGSVESLSLPPPDMRAHGASSSRT